MNSQQTLWRCNLATTKLSFYSACKSGTSLFPAQTDVLAARERETVARPHNFLHINVRLDTADMQTLHGSVWCRLYCKMCSITH